MTKIRLTWNQESVGITTEDVDLIDEDFVLFRLDGEPVPLTVAQLIDKTGQELVFFEDSEGLFGLKPSDIVKIEVLSS